MDNDKIGKFILELRHEKGLSQYALADMIPISREAVSRWERGKSTPDKSALKRLSEIFHVSIDEILMGERKTKKNKEKFEYMSVDILESSNKIKKILKFTIILFLLLLSLFLTYYFIKTYNTIKVYRVKGKDNSISIYNGIIVESKDTLYFHLGEITSEDEIDKIQLYTNIDNKKNVIYESLSSYITLYDFNGYNIYINNKNSKEALDNLYVDILLKDESLHTIKLDIKKDFSNNKIFDNDKDKIIYEDNNNLSYDKESIDIEKIKKVFTKTNDGYLYNDKENNIEYLYIEPINQMMITKIDNNYEQLVVDLNSFYFVYKNEINNEIVEQFKYDGKNVNCIVGECKSPVEKINYFMKNLHNILK